MRSEYERVLEFYRAFGQSDFIRQDAPAITDRVATLKLDLIAEEFTELVKAVLGSAAAAKVAEGYQQARLADDGSRDVVEAADATADLKYVINGFDIEAGIPSEAVFTEVHNSNMSKLDANGRPIISDGNDGYPKGKILKSSTYFAPEVDKVIIGDKHPVDIVNLPQ